MPPEVALGENLDGRSDLYSLGCAAYWMLTGKLLFDAPSPTAMLMRHVQTAPVPPSRVSELEIPPALDAIVLRSLEKRPADRQQSAAELRAELARIELREPWTQERAAAWWQRHGTPR
jgi:eukaryotic-like serine/threonine-protein kinase